MWGRVIEMMLGVWLGLSPFIFGVQADLTLLWIDQIIALAIIVLASLSFHVRYGYAHLLNLGVAIGLCVWGRTAGTPPPFIHQNHIVVGLLLLMFAIVPNQASSPPAAWRQTV